jgi:hypothetical protein
MDQMLGIERALTSRSVYIRLAIGIELLHQKCGAPTGGNGALERAQAEAMVLGVVVMLPEQDDPVGGKARLPRLGSGIR